MIQGTAALSERGARRQNNQDAILTAYTEDAGIFAVADGMGGHFRGELASQSAVSMLREWWEGIRECICSMSFPDVVEDLERRVRNINREIFWMYKDIGQTGGTTLCLLLVCRDAYMVLNIGDSRLYRCRGGRAYTQITVDDVWENQPSVRRRALTEDIRNDCRYGRLTQALGANDVVKPSVSTGLIERKTCFLLCSDGVYKCCKDKWLMSQMKQIRNPKNLADTANHMRKMVYQNGAKDNLSLIIVLADSGRRS